MRRFVSPIPFLVAVSITALVSCSGSESPEPGGSVVAVRITPNNPVVLDNATLAFAAVVVLETGEERDVSDSPSTTWLSSDPGVVSVNADGSAEAEGVGEAYITARYAGITSPAQMVTVNAAPTPTPTPTPAPIADHLVISEVRYSAVPDPGGEFVELHNPTGGNFDISGWTITRDGTTLIVWFTVPAATTLNAGAYLVICNDPAMCGIGGALDSASNTSFPATTGEWIMLRNGTTVIDEMAYGSGDGTGKPVGWCATNAPAANGTAGNSVQRKPTGGDSDVCTDWITNTTATPNAPTL